MSSNLQVSLQSCCTFHQIRTLKNCISPVFLPDIQHGPLQTVFPFQLIIISHEIQLIDSVVAVNIIRGDTQAPVEQAVVGFLVELSKQHGSNCLTAVCPDMKPDGAVAVIWMDSAIEIYAEVSVVTGDLFQAFVVIGHPLREIICDQVLVEKISA